MASPFATLRKYQFAFFVFFGVALMIMFVIDDPLNRWLSGRSGQSQSTNPVVVSWNGGSMTESELDYDQRLRNVILQFLSELLRETQNRKGFPNVAMPSLSPSEEGIVLSRVLASKAEAAGLVVTDEAVMQYLEKLSADLIPRHEIGEMFRKSAGTRMTEQQLLNEMKIELLAQNYLAMAYPDLSRGQLPGQAWNYYQRLHRRVKAEVVPLTVANFKGEVNKDPTDAELKALYEKGKDRYPDPQSAEPGFKRHRKAAFEFVRADRKKFDDEEAAKLKPQITTAEIDEYYTKNKEEFRVRDTDEKPKSDADATSTDKPADKPTAEKPPEEKPAEEKPAAEKAGDKPAETKPAEKPAEQPATESTKEKTESKPEAAKGTEPGTPPSNAPPASPEKSDAKTEDSPKNDQPKNESAKTDGAANSPCGVDLQDDAEKKEQEKKEQEKKETAQPATESKEKADQPAESKPAEAKPAESPKPQDESKPADKPQAPPKPSSEAPPNAADTPKPDETPKSDAAAKAVSKPATYKPLDDKLREEIRDKIANQKGSRFAQERIGNAFNEIRTAVEKYARKTKSAEVTGGAKPEQVNVEKMAKDRALEYGTVPLSDPNQVQEQELGKTFQFDFSGRSFQEIGFHLWAYADGIPLYKPDQIQGRDFNVIFLYWKTQNVDPVVPELNDIRSEVVDAWKQKEAVSVATAKAKSLADKASGKTLKEAFANEKDLTVKETNEFSWMTSGSVAGGMGMPALSSVDGVELAGQDFMKTVFGLKTGEAGVAVNESKSTVYVVRVTSESPSEEILREMFLHTGASMDVQQVAARDRQEIFTSWRESIERDMNVKWTREPRT